MPDEVTKCSIYFAMAFPVGVEMLNTYARKKRGKVVHLYRSNPGSEAEI